jgi:tetratricopeptide (TPR) repeat protein
MKILLSMLFLAFFGYQARGQDTNDSLLNVLKSEVLKKKVYVSETDRRIRTLRENLKSTPKNDFLTRYNICNKLYEEYKDFIFDSAHVYTSKLSQLSVLMHDVPKQYESKIKLGAIQLAWGMFKETFECINQINVHLLQDSVKLRYYQLKSRAYTDLSFYNTDKFYAPASQVEAIKALDSVILLSKPGSYEWYKYSAERCTITGQKAQSRKYYIELLKNDLLTDHQRAMIANDLGNLSKGAEKRRLVTMAAIYDIRSSTKETLAIFALGKLYYEEGNITEAEVLLREALDQAQYYGNKPHKIEIVAILTTLSAQKLINSENEKNRILTFLISILGIAIVGTVIISIIVYVRLKRVRLREIVVKEKNKHLDKINKKLLEDTHIKEEYIGYFFEVISGYILKLEKIKRNTERKLKIKSYEELLHLANEIDIKYEREALFHTFDSIFLKLFPNFITAFNALLKPEDQIWPKDNEVLNTNLRIFALMRLGIKDNQTIANILESAVSTIYTYKIRIKSKALVPGDEFENKIMEIKFVDINNMDLQPV